MSFWNVIINQHTDSENLPDAPQTLPSQPGPAVEQLADEPTNDQATQAIGGHPSNATANPDSAEDIAMQDAHTPDDGADPASDNSSATNEKKRQSFYTSVVEITAGLNVTPEQWRELSKAMVDELKSRDLFGTMVMTKGQHQDPNDPTVMKLKEALDSMKGVLLLVKGTDGTWDTPLPTGPKDTDFFLWQTALKVNKTERNRLSNARRKAKKAEKAAAEEED
jgi:hypothetical protein